MAGNKIHSPGAGHCLVTSGALTDGLQALGPATGKRLLPGVFH